MGCSWQGSLSGRHAAGVISRQWSGLDGKRGQALRLTHLTARGRPACCCISDARVMPCYGAGLGGVGQVMYAEPRENARRLRLGAENGL